jgi:Protein of unknown function (DUF2891)
MPVELSHELAEDWAALTLANVAREYPNKLDHVLAGADDVRAPRELHPVFYGCFDWHSCVHGYWLLARLRRLFPALEQRSRVEDHFNRHLTHELVQIEIDYFTRPHCRGFERPYGWAWLLMLAAELKRSPGEPCRRWHAALGPLASVVVERFMAFLPRATYPIRSGTHSNTAFAIALAHEYARLHDDQMLHELLFEKARTWYARDQDCQAWEPSGDDFLSPALVEAECIRRIFLPEQFRSWLAHFLPHLRDGEPRALFEPAVVSDRTDGKIAHLDGLNFSRAWCWRGIASALDAADPLKTRLLDAADHHLSASLPHVRGDYAGEHWLATFALLALTGTP